MEPVESVPWQVIPTICKPGPDGKMQFAKEDKYGEKSFAQVIEQVKPDIVWALGDFYMLKHVFDMKDKYPTVPFIVHMAVDGEPWHQNLTSTFRSADHVVAISDYGADVLTTVMGKKADFIHHGVNTNVFERVPDERREQIRNTATGGVIKKDDFVIGWVGKDQYRKQIWKFWELMHYITKGDYIECLDCEKLTLMEYDKQKQCSRPIGKLRMYRPDYDYKTCYHCNSENIKTGEAQPDIYGWSHMAWNPSEGWNPNQLSDIWDVRKQIYMTHGLGPNKGVPIKELVDLYNVFDIFYCMSGGEGFGLPVLEAMSAEVPVVYSNYSAHAEVVGDTGVAVDTNFTCEMNSCFDRAFVNTADAVKKILDLKKDRDKVREMGKAARERAMTITWDAVGQEWLEYIDEVAQSVNHSYGVAV
jgi:glycosyltransferase involved in cell wall biosynthesis